MQDYQLFLWLPDVQKAVIGMPRATPCAQQAVRLLRVASHRRCIRTEIQAPMRGKRGNRGPSSNTRWSRGAKGKVHYQILRHHCIASAVKHTQGTRSSAGSTGLRRGDIPRQRQRPQDAVALMLPVHHATAVRRHCLSKDEPEAATAWAWSAAPLRPPVEG